MPLAARSNDDRHGHQRRTAEQQDRRRHRGRYRDRPDHRPRLRGRGRPRDRGRPPGRTARRDRLGRPGPHHPTARRHHRRGRARADRPASAGDPRPVGRTGQQRGHRTQRSPRHTHARDDRTSDRHQPRRTRPAGTSGTARPGADGRPRRQRHHLGGPTRLAGQLGPRRHQERSGAVDPESGGGAGAPGHPGRRRARRTARRTTPGRCLTRHGPSAMRRTWPGRRSVPRWPPSWPPPSRRPTASCKGTTRRAER